MKRHQASELIYYWMENVSKQETTKAVQAEASANTGSGKRPAPPAQNG